MIVASLLALASTAAATPAPQGAHDEIVVVAQKLKDWRGAWQLRKGRFSCKTTRSTGDRAIDAVGCNALQACIEPRLADFKAIAERKEKRAIQNAKLDALAKSLTPCVAEARKHGVEELASQRTDR